MKEEMRLNDIVVILENLVRICKVAEDYPNLISFEALAEHAQKIACEFKRIASEE